MRDGWAPYRKLPQATHQTCVAHLLRRHLLLETAQRGAARFPHAVRRLLLRTLALRERPAGSSMATDCAWRSAASRRRLSTMASGKSDELKGRVKEAAGALTADEKLKREGKVDQAVGKIKQTVEKVVDKVKDALELSRAPS